HLGLAWLVVTVVVNEVPSVDDFPEPRRDHDCEPIDVGQIEPLHPVVLAKRPDECALLTVLKSGDATTQKGPRDAVGDETVSQVSVRVTEGLPLYPRADRADAGDLWMIRESVVELPPHPHSPHSRMGAQPAHRLSHRVQPRRRRATAAPVPSHAA